MRRQHFSLPSQSHRQGALGPYRFSMLGALTKRGPMFLYAREGVSIRCWRSACLPRSLTTRRSSSFVVTQLSIDQRSELPLHPLGNEGPRNRLFMGQTLPSATHSTPEPLSPRIKALCTAMNTRIIGSVTITTEAKITFCGVTSPWFVVPTSARV